MEIGDPYNILIHFCDCSSTFVTKNVVFFVSRLSVGNDIIFELNISLNH